MLLPKLGGFKLKADIRGSLSLLFTNRESVATFLTRGDLWISWVQGKDTFEELMLDFEPSVSCGCWMRSSCSAFFTGEVEGVGAMTT